MWCCVHQRRLHPSDVERVSDVPDLVWSVSTEHVLGARHWISLTVYGKAVDGHLA